MLTAITRKPSPALANCELEFLSRVAIDLAKAAEQHQRYEDCLAEFGARVLSLPAEENFPDSMFVEDPAIVLDEIAIMTRPGAASRRGEGESLARALQPFRELKWIAEPGTLEGGDVMRIDRTIYVGASRRTNAEGIAQLARFTEPLGYSVVAVPVTGSLHLKSACCCAGNGVVLANRNWFDAGALRGVRILDVPANEPSAANVLSIGETVLVPVQFPKTRALLEAEGFRVRTLDISEALKAEAALTCSSLIFDA
ncbi:MAG TPA: dimethylargininase [Bryobacteraceae bacterium]|jgi:dimethylargininase